MLSRGSVKQIFWTEERIEILRDLRARGEPFRIIGDELGTTRSAIAGKVNRLKLPNPQHHRAPAKPRPRDPNAPKRPRKPRLVRDPAPRIVVAPVHAPPAEPVGFFALRDWHCRAIVGADRFGFSTYCGHQKQSGSSWCAMHHRLYLQPLGNSHGQTGSRNQRLRPHYRQ